MTNTLSANGVGYVLCSWTTLTPCPIDQMRQQLCRVIEANAAARGWRASAAFSPDESEWSVTDRAVIFKLLDMRLIGVTLTESLVMLPIKSLSLILRGSDRVRWELRAAAIMFLHHS